MSTLEGSLRAMNFQMAPVAKPLGSVIRKCQAGHTVVFDDDGSYILNISGEIKWFREDNGNYMLDVWIPPASHMDPKLWQKPEAPREAGS